MAKSESHKTDKKATFPPAGFLQGVQKNADTFDMISYQFYLTMLEEFTVVKVSETLAKQSLS